MKSFQNFITEMDTGLVRKMAKSGMGTSQFNDPQEEAITAVTNLIIMIAAIGSSNFGRLKSTLDNLSARDPAMKAVYDQINFNALKAGGKENEDNLIATSPDDAMRHGV